jgi:hypothetical protein
VRARARARARRVRIVRCVRHGTIEPNPLEMIMKYLPMSTFDRLPKETQRRLASPCRGWGGWGLELGSVAEPKPDQR